MSQSNTEVIQALQKIIDKFFKAHGYKAELENQEPKIRSVFVIFNQMRAAFAVESAFDAYLQGKFSKAIDDFNIITKNANSFPDQQLYQDAALCIHNILDSMKKYAPLNYFIMEYSYLLQATDPMVDPLVRLVVETIIRIYSERNNENFISTRLDATINSLRSTLHDKKFPLRTQYELRLAAFKVLNSIDSDSSTTSTPPTLLFRRPQVEIPFDCQYDPGQRGRPVEYIRSDRQISGAAQSRNQTSQGVNASSEHEACCDAKSLCPLM